MRFHDFEVEGGGGTKLEEWHSLAKMRPLAPPAHKPKPEADPRQAGAAPSQPDGKKPKTPGAQAPAFLRKLVEGNALELLHEDGIWPVDLVGISDEKGYRPPRASAKQARGAHPNPNPNPNPNPTPNPNPKPNQVRAPQGPRAREHPPTAAQPRSDRGQGQG